MLFSTSMASLLVCASSFVLLLGSAHASGSAGSPCNVTGTWQSVGADDPIVVVEAADFSFVATPRSGWSTAPGKIFPSNASLFLDCCSPNGIFGTINSACTLISWDDGVGSQWSRPPAPVPRNVTISNLLPRRDDTGQILRVQDGCLSNFGGVWYLYGARYQCCDVSEQAACYQPCGWRNATFAVYSSPDLETWHLESADIFPIVSDPSSPHSNTRNAYFEPCVLYSKAADHYVLWFLNTNTKGVAVSDSPVGPFESVSWDTGLAQGSDSYFWQDADDPLGTVYVKHNGPPPPGDTRGTHYVSQLAPDLLSVLPDRTSGPMMVPALPVPPAYQGNWPSCSEGGGIFSTGGRWYVMAGVCCCFCHAGANAFVWVSESGPLGPYTLQNITGPSGLMGNIIPFNTSSGMCITGAQQFSVAPIPVSNGTVVPCTSGSALGAQTTASSATTIRCGCRAASTPRQASWPTWWVDEWTVEVNTYPSGKEGGG
jgi:hypothetical protein